MLDKLCALNQTIYVRHGNDKPDVHQRVVRNLEETEGRIYGECTIDDETWIVRYIGNAKWQSVGKRVDLDAMIQGLEAEPLSARERELATTPWQQCTRNRVM